MSAVIARYILAVIIRIQPVFLLILFLLRKTFENMEMRIDIIIEVSVELIVELAVIRPCCIVRRNEFKSGKNAERIGGSRVYRLRLRNEIADYCQLIAFNLDRPESEIFICKPECRSICGEALRNGQAYRNGSQRAYTLGKLKQEVPRRASLLITAGKHIEKSCEFLRDRNL